MPHSRRKIVLLLALLALAGCTTPVHKGKSPLMPTQMSSDSVALDIFFVRFPFGDPTINEKLWNEIDEQQLPPDLRERLAKNGFRAGIINGSIPAELAKLMKLSDKPAPTGELGGSQVVDFEAQPRVVRRHLQIRTDQPSPILASSIYPELTVFVNKSGQLSGKTFNEAQCVFSTKILPQPDGRVRLSLAPELQHDQPRPRWIANQGVLSLDTSKPKEVYEDMTIAADLPSGAMLIVSSLASRPGSLGHCFFTDDANRRDQKLLVVRLSQTQSDGLFNPPEPLKLAE
jgi:hypothetical protein